MSTTLQPTTDATSAIITSLENLVADTYALLAQTHLAHWNVVGSDFFALHTFLQTQYEELFTGVDLVAEQIRTMDAFPPGGLASLAAMSPIEEMERRLSAKDFMAGLAEGHEKLIERAKVGRKAAGDAGDTESEDLFIERLRVHQKHLWMLLSHLK